ncbi:hypothetical protein PI126_g12948 [Phytophthora idaei]|nr:hypothetical protein PI126_g12948 [Phytophthora idaei]
MNDLASVMQAMCMPKSKGMLEALKQFRDQAALVIVPQLDPHRNVTSAFAPDKAEPTAETEQDSCGGGLDGVGSEDTRDRTEAPTTKLVGSFGVDTRDRTEAPTTKLVGSFGVDTVDP